MADLHVFDFDGTLVETAGLKRQAFFDIFPDADREAVAGVLARHPDASRHEVIPKMAAAAGDPALEPGDLIAAYGARVTERVRAAPELPGAAAALAWAAGHGTACLFSMTPHDDLEAAVTARGWDRYLSDMRGYPAKKPDSLRDWIARFSATRVTVIGDGESDAAAAAAVGARFLRADPGWPEKLMEGGAP